MEQPTKDEEAWRNAEKMTNTDMDNYQQPLNSVKLTKNTKGVNWEIRVVEGCKEEDIEALRKVALLQHHELIKELENTKITKEPDGSEKMIQGPS